MPFFSNIKEKLSEYVDIRMKLYQVKLEEKAIDLISSMSFFVLLLSSAGLALLFFLLFLARVVNYFVGYEFAGYGIVALICIFMCAFLLRKESQQYVIGKIKQLIIQNLKSRDDGSEDTGSI